MLAANEIVGDVERKPRVGLIDPGAERGPGLTTLNRPLMRGPFGERHGGRNRATFAAIEQTGERLDRRLERRHGRRLGDRKRILGDDEAARARGALQVHAKQDLADASEQVGIAGEPPDRVEARRLADDALKRQTPVGRADAVESAEACRDTHRAAGIGAERKIHQPAGDSRGRSAGGPAGHAARGFGIGGRAVMGVLAENAARQFVGMSLADHLGAAVDENLHDWRRARRRRVRRQPIRISGAGHVPGDVEQIFRGKLQAGERSASGARQIGRRMRAEGIQRIVHLSAHRHSRATAFTAASLVGRPAISARLTGLTGGRRR